MFQYSLTERTVPVSVPGKRFRQFRFCVRFLGKRFRRCRFPVPVGFLGHPSGNRKWWRQTGSRQSTHYRRYGPDTEIQYRPQKPHGPAKPSRILSKREADTEFQYRPHIVDTDTIADAVFADAISETSNPDREVLNAVGADGVGVKFPIFPTNCSRLRLSWENRRKTKKKAKKSEEKRRKTQKNEEKRKSEEKRKKAKKMGKSLRPHLHQPHLHQPH